MRARRHVRSYTGDALHCDATGANAIRTRVVHRLQGGYICSLLLLCRCGLVVAQDGLALAMDSDCDRVLRRVDGHHYNIFRLATGICEEVAKRRRPSPLASESARPEKLGGRILL